MNLAPSANRPVRVLVVDDSVTQRGALVALINADAELTVIGWAANGADAARATALLKPDVIAMDLRMPVMDGLEATRQILQETPTPIVLVTGGSDGVYGDEQRLAFEALEAGVLAVLRKPGPGPAGQAATGVVSNPQEYGPGQGGPPVVRRPAATDNHREWSRTVCITWSPLEVVAIGASTGGPPVLRTILVGLPSAFSAPVLIVQHIAEDFAVSLVDWLRPQCALPIEMGVDGQALNRPGIFVAPPGRHMGVRGGPSHSSTVHPSHSTGRPPRTCSSRWPASMDALPSACC